MKVANEAVKERVCAQLREALETFQAMTTDKRTTIPEAAKQRALIDGLVRQLENIDAEGR